MQCYVLSDAAKTCDLLSQEGAAQINQVHIVFGSMTRCSQTRANRDAASWSKTCRIPHIVFYCPFRLRQRLAPAVWPNSSPLVLISLALALYLSHFRTSRWPVPKP